MPGPLVFSLYNFSGVPLTGATPSFVAYHDRTGSPRSVPTIVEIGSGSYKFTPALGDEVIGTAALIDAGVSSSPRRLAASIYNTGETFVSFLLEDGAGALWTGSLPTVGFYKHLITNNNLTPPSIVNVTGSFLFSFSPDIVDKHTGVAYRINSPALAYPEYLTGYLLELTGSAVISTTNPAITNFVPATGSTLSRSGTIGFDVTDDNSFRRIMVVVEFPAKNIYEVVHDGDVFGPMYQGVLNTKTSIVGGFTYQVLRDGGWIDTVLSFKPVAIDEVGNENT